LHGILYRQACLLCSYAKENVALASVGLPALAVTMLPLSGTCNKLHAQVTGLGPQVVSQSVCVTRIQWNEEHSFTIWDLR